MTKVKRQKITPIIPLLEGAKGGLKTETKYIIL
jgi:hypothetical protein